MDKPNVDILRALYVNRKHIIIATIVCSLVSVVITMPFIMKPKYRSQAYLFPANMVPFFMEQNYNNVSHTELLMQFFNSNDVRKDVMHKLNLSKHYNLDTTDSHFTTEFNNIFEENIKASLTKYESVELTVLDHNPDTAKLIASTIIASVNKLILKQHLEKFNEYVSINKEYLKQHRKSLDSLQAAMETFTKQYGLIDMGSQMREASRNYYKLLAEGKENKRIKDDMENMAAHGPEFFRLGNSFTEEARMYANVENELEKSVRDFSRKLTYMVVASEPTQPDAKYWPKRGFIATLTAIASFILACVYFVYIDRLKEIVKSVKAPK